jgi:hypothetical protein
MRPEKLEQYCCTILAGLEPPASPLVAADATIKRIFVIEKRIKSLEKFPPDRFPGGLKGHKETLTLLRETREALWHCWHCLERFRVV